MANKHHIITLDVMFDDGEYDNPDQWIVDFINKALDFAQYDIKVAREVSYEGTGRPSE